MWPYQSGHSGVQCMKIKNQYSEHTMTTMLSRFLFVLGLCITLAMSVTYAIVTTEPLGDAIYRLASFLAYNVAMIAIFSNTKEAGKDLVNGLVFVFAGSAATLVMITAVTTDLGLAGIVAICMPVLLYIILKLFNFVKNG